MIDLTVHPDTLEFPDRLCLRRIGFVITAGDQRFIDGKRAAVQVVDLGMKLFRQIRAHAILEQAA